MHLTRQGCRQSIGELPGRTSEDGTFRTKQLARAASGTVTPFFAPC